MGRKIRKCFCILLAASLLFGGMPQTAAAGNQKIVQQDVYSMQVQASRANEENGVTVTTPEAFMEALRLGKSPITVGNSITVDNGEDAADKRMLPVEIPADTIIQGAEEVDVDVNFRSPLQINGDRVCFRNINLRFLSGNAMGSVPHREIFLAGHSLTLDNVGTYLKGGDGGEGSIVGSEKEQLPTVYAGGYTGTSNGENASLTVQNSNQETMFQAIYLGHGAENDKKVPYQGEAVLHMDAGATVRAGVDASLNSKAEIVIADEENTYARVSEIYGNENTTVTLSKSIMERATVVNVGNLVLQEEACLSLAAAALHHVTLKSGACLDLNEAGDVIISGDFTAVENPAEKRGILVLNQDGSVTIEGTVTGTTQFQTRSRLFPGGLTVGKSYIITDQEVSSDNNFILSQANIDSGYKLVYCNGVWSADREQMGILSISRVEILSSPHKVDLRNIVANEDGTIPDETVYFEVNWYDGNGEKIGVDVVDEYGFYYESYVIPIKTEYWESNDTAVLDKTDWGLPVFLMGSEDNPGKYYLQAGIGGQPGDYTFLFCSDDHYEKTLDTVADVKALSGTVLKEQRVVFYDQDDNEPEEHEHVYQETVTKPATCTAVGVKTYLCSCGDKYTQMIEALGHQEVIDEAIAPTETMEGKTEGSHCGVCGAILKEQQVIPATGGNKDPEEHIHRYQESVTKPATCTEKGVKTYTCSCGEQYTRDIEALGHQEVIDAAIAPTETTEGKTEGSHCSVCGTVLKEQQVIPATGGNKDPEDPKDPEEHIHRYQESVTKQATCTEKGVKTYICSCGHKYTRDIAAMGHKFTERRIPATLNKDGNVQQVCSVCSEAENVSVIYHVQEITLDKTDYVYNGKVMAPALTVQDSKGRTLAANRDYQVTYAAGRKNPGVYTVTVAFMGNYSGKADVNFTIRPKGCSLGKIAAKSKGFLATWKKQSAQTSGYELQYCTARNFKGRTAKTVNIKKNTAVKKKITKLKAKKKYFVRIRTYKTVKVNGKRKNLYSDWSKLKAVRTKK